MQKHALGSCSQRKLKGGSHGLQQIAFAIPTETPKGR